MFITFEGIEGCGKSTALAFVAAALAERRRAVVTTREPGGTALGKSLRNLLLDPANTHIQPTTELFLYLADRAQHVNEIVRPALDRGNVVLSDRYADSTIVYQGYGRGLLAQDLERLNDLAVGGLWPGLTLLLDLDPEVGLARARQRNHQDGSALDEGRFEAEDMAFHTRVREGFLQWADRNPKRFRLVDAAGSREAVGAACLDAVLDHLGIRSDC